MSYGEQPPNTSTDEVISLIHALYSARPVKDIQYIEKTLQDLQKREIGWELANTLLTNDVVYVQFFGALTYTVKLNTDASSLSAEDYYTLLATLLQHFIRVIHAPQPSRVVVRKLAQCIAILAIKNQKVFWLGPVRLVVGSIFAQEVVQGTNVDIAPMIERMPNAAKFGGLEFIHVLGEEASRAQPWKVGAKYVQIEPLLNAALSSILCSRTARKTSPTA